MWARVEYGSGRRYGNEYNSSRYQVVIDLSDDDECEVVFNYLERALGFGSGWNPADVKRVRLRMPRRQLLDLAIAILETASEEGGKGIRSVKFREA